jgi:exopolysaccharide biosynthesis polyprenyl glycosylphosphotransferase
MSLADRISAERETARTFPAVVPLRRPAASRWNKLRALLVTFDTVSLIGAWVFAAFVHWTQRELWANAVIIVGSVVAGLWLLNAHDLYLARISTIRSVELSRVSRSVFLLGCANYVGRSVIGFHFQQRDILVGMMLTMVLMFLGRGAYRAWLTANRRDGRFLRDILIVGAGSEAGEILDVLEDHPEAGYRVVGVTGNRDRAVEHGIGHLWCGSPADTVDALQGRRASGVIIATSAIDSEDLSDLVRSLQAQKIHIQLSNGVKGTDFRRMRATPIAYEPFYYIESPVLARGQDLAKRTLDLVLAALGIVLAAPLFGLIAAIIKLQDGGPVFFRQTRVGQDGRHFKVLKFRTMVIDAEAKLAALKGTNERNGPLFKMDRDPRVTRMGHFLRNSSLDEMPQLMNVLKGEMSLVGPRPALPSEVANFDDMLLNRTKVLPGITGLWQVEARDNPSFAAYRRLDLFYVDNWSISLDLIIMMATIEQVVAKLVFSIFRRGQSQTLPPRLSISRSPESKAV